MVLGIHQIAQDAAIGTRFDCINQRRRNRAMFAAEVALEGAQSFGVSPIPTGTR